MKHVILAVKSHFQIPGRQTVYQHGLSVFRHTLAIRAVLEGGEHEQGLKIPTWLIENRAFILRRLVDHKTLKHYCLWHDLGKPFCKPDH
jgi:hypothetical protein